MSKILIPVDPSIRKPVIIKDILLCVKRRVSGIVIVRYINKIVSESFSELSLAYFDYEDNIWRRDILGDSFFQDKNNQVTKWYEEIEIESLFPDEDLSYHVAQAAANNHMERTIIHQEGQSFFKNYIIKQLKK